MKKGSIQAKSEQDTIVYNKVSKLDLKDIHILKALYKDSRASFSDLSKEVKLSRDAVRYRIERLVKNEVIQGFIPLVNPPALGFPVLTVLQLKLQNFSPEREKKLLSYFKNSKYVSNFAALTGSWDYFVLISAKNLGHLNEILKDIRNNFSDIIKEYESSNVLQTYKVSMYNNLL